MSEKFNWTKEKVKLLIEKYKALPELWDSRCNLYENRVRKQNALMKLANELEIDEREIQRKIYNLRTQFFQEYKKIKKRPPGAKQCSVKWEFYDSLKFILSSHLRRKPADITRGIHRTEDTTVNLKMDTSSSSENLCSSPEPSVLEQPQMKRRLKQRSQNTSILKEATSSDEYQIFGDYVASELRNIKSPIIRRKLKRALQLAIVHHSEMDDNNTYISTIPSSSSSSLIQHEHSSYFIKQGPLSVEQAEQDLPSTSDDREHRNIQELSVKTCFEAK